MSKHRVLTIAHGHPDFNKGGAEIAAYNLHKAYSARDDVEQALFLARIDRGKGAVGRVSQRTEREFLWEQSTHDMFMMKATNQFEVHGYFREFITATRPTVVHMHHYFQLGLEIIRIIKQVDPDIKIVMTLHEYIAICANEGQMVKFGSQKLCYASGFEDCHRCMPAHTPEDFWLRKHRFQNYFRFVDTFVAPSEFLRGRYIDWGLPADKIVVIENGQTEQDPLPPRPVKKGEARNRFAFFGQINRFKGLGVILEALNCLSEEQRKDIVFEVHGANLETQTQEFQDLIARLRMPLELDGTLHWIGPYEQHQMASRLSNVDWVIVPSIWWENSPMVIQEALAFGRPVLVSDIGGMAEKIEDGVNGRHVPMGDIFAWASMFTELADDPVQWSKLHKGITKPLTYAECAQQHLALF